MFHRIDDPMQMDSPRYYRLAELLVHYDGAVSHALAAELQRRSGPLGVHVQPGAASSMSSATSPPAPAVTLSGPALAALTDDQGQGLPGIEYSGG